MKNLKKTVALILTFCLTAGLFAMLPMSTSAEEAAQSFPHTYELYDYFNAHKTAYDAGTAFVNDSAWSMQSKKYNADTWISDMSVCDRDIQDPSWHYIRPDYDSPWLYSAGFAYQIYGMGSGRYMNALAIPSNLATNADFKYDVAYAFTAPQTGIYSIGKADQNLVWSFYDTDAFHMMSVDEQLDFGVRVTVDNQTIWPTADNEYYRDGWAEFGNKDAKISYLNVPGIDNITISKDSVLRVEFTQFTPCANTWDQRILGMVSVTYVKPASVEIPVPTTDQLPISYEVYDFYNAFIEGTGANTPWAVSVSQDGTSWHDADRSYQEGDYYYMHYNGISWGDNWPGCKFFRPANYQELDRYYFGYITPSNGGTALHTNAAYSFTTPFTGNYEFDKSSRDKCYSFYEMDYIRVDGNLANADYGVRITVDGTTVWPEKNNSLNTEGWIHFGTKAGLTNGIEIPNLDLYLVKGQVLRMEFADFAGMEWPWNNSISGLPSVTLKTIDGIAVENTHEFEDAGLYLDEIAATVNTNYELYDGDILHSKNVETAANDGVTLQVQASALGNGVKVGVNGFMLLLNGENSSLTSPGGTVEPVSIPLAENGLYNISYAVLPAFAANEITGAFVTATVNGISYEKLFAGETSAGASSDGIVFENRAGGNITIMPADLALNTGSSFIYNNLNRVLYVGETTDVAAIRTNIRQGARYSFVGEVVTGKTFMRAGSDCELMTYSIAVKADVNADGVSDIKDLIRLKKGISGMETLSAAQKTAATFGESDIADAQTLTAIRGYLMSR